MGGHRFFTKVEEVKKIWHEVLGRDLLQRPAVPHLLRPSLLLLPLRLSTPS